MAHRSISSSVPVSRASGLGFLVLARHGREVAFAQPPMRPSAASGGFRTSHFPLRPRACSAPERSAHVEAAAARDGHAQRNDRGSSPDPFGVKLCSGDDEGDEVRRAGGRTRGRLR